MRDEAGCGSGAMAFALIYFTFFLDNVLLTVLVPIIPDWVRGEALALWAQHDDAPLASLLNGTVRAASERGAGARQAAVGAVLGARAAAQLACAPLAAAAVCRLGPARVLRAATVLLALAALVFTVCSSSAPGVAGAWCAGCGRAVQGAGGAGAGVGGLALAAAALPARARDRAMPALLGAVALGVLVGYPFGGAAYAMWSRGTPFLMIAAALLANVAMQYMFLDKEEYNRPCPSAAGARAGWRGAGGGWQRAARRGATGACAGAVLLTTCVMAALEPCLPPWIMDKFHPQRWVTGAVFVPDSAGYLVAATLAGGAARRAGAERVALAGVLAVGLGALALPHATSVAGLGAPHVLVGGGLGAVDGALVPALVGRARGWRVPALAALLQGAGSAAYALGPLAGGAAAAGVGFESTMRALGVLNVLYAALLYRALRAHPLSEQWGARAADEDAEGGSDSDSEDSGAGGAELGPPRPR